MLLHGINPAARKRRLSLSLSLSECDDDSRPFARPSARNPRRRAAYREDVHSLRRKGLKYIRQKVAFMTPARAYNGTRRLIGDTKSAQTRSRRS